VALIVLLGFESCAFLIVVSPLSNRPILFAGIKVREKHLDPPSNIARPRTGSATEIADVLPKIDVWLALGCRDKLIHHGKEFRRLLVTAKVV
jgi:hypothetical protein